MEVNGYRQLFAFHFFLNVFFCVHKLKEIHKDSEQLSELFT